MSLDTYGTTTLDSSGNGSVRLGPRVGVLWNPTVAAVSTSTATKFPVCAIYVGGSSTPGQLVDATYTGNSDSTSKLEGTAVYPGHYVWAVWTGGDVGATATLSLFGTQKTGYRNG
jgi:hypothetical protein